MAEEYQLKAKLGLDAKDYEKGLKDASDKTGMLEKSMSKVATSIKALFTAGGVAAAFGAIKKIFDSTQLSGDKLQQTIKGIQEVATTAAQNLASLDFSVSLVNAYKAAKQLESVYDDLADRQRSINVLSAENALEIAKLQGIVRDTTKSEKERQAAAERINKIYKEEWDLRRNMVETAIKGEIDALRQKYSISEKDALAVLDYVFNYSKFTKEQQDALTKAMEAQKKLDNYMRNTLTPFGEEYEKNIAKRQKAVNEAMAEVPEEMRKWVALWRPISDLSDKHRDRIAEILSNYYQVIASEQNRLNMVERINNRLDEQGEKIKRIQGFEGIAPIAGIPTLPSLAPAVGATLKTDIYATISERAKLTGEDINTLAMAFANLGETIGVAVQDGALNFSEAMNIISKMASETVGVLTTLAAAGIFAKEGLKGLIGVGLAVSGIATMMSVISAVKSRKMAEGGIVYGPTLAMIGEYQGARSNPEVVAPLSKLQNMIQRSGHITVDVTGKIKGEDLVLIVEKAYSSYYRKV